MTNGLDSKLQKLYLFTFTMNYENSNINLVGIIRRNFKFLYGALAQSAVTPPPFGCLFIGFSDDNEISHYNGGLPA